MSGTRKKIVYVATREGKRPCASVARRYGTSARPLTDLKHLRKKSRLAADPYLYGGGGVVAGCNRAKSKPVVAQCFNKYYTVRKGDNNQRPCPSFQGFRKDTVCPGTISGRKGNSLSGPVADHRGQYMEKAEKW